MPRRCVGALALLLTLGGLAPAQPAAHKTPQEVFEAYLAAFNRGDHKAVLACHPPEVIPSWRGTWPSTASTGGGGSPRAGRSPGSITRPSSPRWTGMA